MTLKKRNTIFLLAAAALAVFAVVRAGGASENVSTTYNLLTTITISDLVGFDISWVDSARGRYYLADRGTGNTPATPRIDVIDTETNTLLQPISLTSAPNGVLTFRSSGNDDNCKAGTLVAGLANSTAAFIDLAHPTAAPVVVNTGGNHRADELAYDPVDHLILIANDQDVNASGKPAPYISFISTEHPPSVVSNTDKIVYDGTGGNPQSTGGIEQSVWDGATRRFYLAIPSTVANATGEVDEINPKTKKITRAFPTSCSPAGLVLIPGQQLMTSCGDVLSVHSGKVVHPGSGVGGDEIWFNSGDDRVYFGGGTDRISVPVVNALNPFGLVTKLVVGSTTVTPTQTTHSVAADSANNRIFVPVGHVGVKVYTDATNDE